MLYGNKITSLQSRLFEGLTSLQVFINVIVIVIDIIIVIVIDIIIIVIIIIVSVNLLTIFTSAAADQREQDRVHQGRHLRQPHLLEPPVS